MHRRRRREFLRVLGVAGAGTVAGCGSSGGGQNDDGDDPETEGDPETPADSKPATGTATASDTDTVTDGESTEPDDPAATPGSFSRSGQTKLFADDGDSVDRFGETAAVSADGSLVLVGAPGDEDPNGQEGGSVYAFERADGGWSQQAKLFATDGTHGDAFGVSIAVTPDGSTALFGAVGDNDPNGAGSAYVFERSGGEWSQGAKLTSDDPTPDEEFGWSVALTDDGSTALVGAYGDRHPNGPMAGAAYVFERSGGEWTQRAKLTAPDGDRDDQFGWSVALSADGSTALVGAGIDEDPNGEWGGSAYVFERSGDEWTQQAKLSDPDGNSEAEFGTAVDLSADGSIALIGAPRDGHPQGERMGTAYVFQRADGDWTPQSHLLPAPSEFEYQFGGSVDLTADGSAAILGALFYFTEDDGNIGSAYVLEESGGEWVEQANLIGSDVEEWDQFGMSVALSDDHTTAVVGAFEDDDPNGDLGGSAYVFW